MKQQTYTVVRIKNHFWLRIFSLIGVAALLCAVMLIFILRLFGLIQFQGEVKEFLREVNKQHEITSKSYEDQIKNLELTIQNRENDIKILQAKLDLANGAEKNFEEALNLVANKYMYVLEYVEDHNVPNPISIMNLYHLDRVCEEKNMDPHLVLGIFHLESGFNTRAKSSISTASGLGQFLDSTGEWIYNTYLNYASPYDHNVSPFVPDINIEMTVVYLSQLISENNGNIAEALMAYNGGEIGNLYFEKVYAYMAQNGLGAPRLNYR